MLKIGLTAAVTAALTVAVMAATGFASEQARTIKLRPGDRVMLASNNFQCQVLTKTQVACGRKTLRNSVVVYFQPKQLDVVKTNKKGTGGTVVFKIRR